ncbi:MAG: hypothetical protein ACFCBV_07435 [Phycisphaerales bacterium]
MSVRIALACLTLAVVLAVGSVPVLAWRAQAPHLGSLWSTIDLYEFEHPDRGPTSAARQRLLGFTTWHHAPVHPPVQGFPSPSVVEHDPRPSWAVPVSEPWPEMHFAFRVGVPLRSAAGWYEVPGSSEQAIGRFFLAQPPSRNLSLHLRNRITDFPIVVVWPGLIANTIIFFAIPFVPWTLWRWRRFSRIERLDLCYRCLYEFPREIEICPECGTRRPPARRAAR